MAGTANDGAGSREPRRADDLPVALAEDGELSEVRELLATLGVEAARIGPRGRPPDDAWPARLLVASARRALLGEYRRERRVPRPATWLAIGDDVPPRIAARLLDAGFDRVLQRPVHPAHLQALVARARFRGHPQRRGPRTLLALRASCGSAWRLDDVTLLDLSAQGARLLIERAAGAGLRPGDERLLRLPGQARRDALRARVTRVVPAVCEGASRDELSVGLCFEAVGPSQRAALATLTRAWRDHSAAWCGALPGRAGWRARAERAHYVREVLVWGAADGVRVLRARDLSARGIGLDADPELEPARPVVVGLDGGPGAPLICASGRVARNDPETGAAVAIESLDEPSRERFRELLERLPAAQG